MRLWPVGVRVKRRLPVEASASVPPETVVSPVWIEQTAKVFSTGARFQQGNFAGRIGNRSAERAIAVVHADTQFGR